MRVDTSRRLVVGTGEEKSYYCYIYINQLNIIEGGNVLDVFKNGFKATSQVSMTMC